MSDITLYMAPGTCARVTAIALEELQLPFTTQVVRFLTKEHKSPAYTALNPLGKVPALVHKGEVLTENLAILFFLNETYGGLLPKAETPLDHARQLADLGFCASTLHPLVTRIRMPFAFAGPEQASVVKTAACGAMDEFFHYIDRRLAASPWWYGEDWSAMDGYLFWVFFRVEGAGYDVSRFAHYRAHARAMEARPAVQRALAREQATHAVLEQEGLVFTPPDVPILAADSPKP